MAEGKGLAIAALALGILGLFTAGGLGIGSVVGLGLAAAALTRRRPGGDVAWAAVAANVFALLTLVPVTAAVWTYWRSPQAFATDDDSLPEPAPWPGRQIDFVAEPTPSTSPRVTGASPSTVEAPHPRQRPAAPPATGRREPPSQRNAAAQTAAMPRPVTAPADAGAPPERNPSAERIATAEPVRAGSGIPEPRRIRHVDPVYPPAAIAARLQGAVVLECTISSAGKVVAVKTLRAVPLLEQAAIDAVKQWEYEPTIVNGRAVPVIMTVTVNFKLS